MGSLHWCFHCSYSMPPHPSTMLEAQFNTLFGSVKALQESMTELQASNSRMLSSICHVRSLLQEEMLDSTTFADADTKDATVKIEMDTAAIVSTRRHFDLVEENTSSEGNCELRSEMLDKIMEPSKNNLQRCPPFILSGEISPLEFGIRAEAFADQVFDGNSQRSNTEFFLQNILHPRYGHQFGMYHCCWLDTGQTLSLMTLTGAVKCHGNEPATIGVFVSKLVSVVEDGQSNLVDHMFDEMPHYRLKVFDPGPSFATVLITGINSTFASELASSLNDKKPTNQDDVASSQYGIGVIITSSNEKSDITWHKDTRKMFVAKPDRGASMEVDEFVTKYSPITQNQVFDEMFHSCCYKDYLLPIAPTKFPRTDPLNEEALMHRAHNEPCLQAAFVAILGASRDVWWLRDDLCIYISTWFDPGQSIIVSCKNESGQCLVKLSIANPGFWWAMVAALTSVYPIASTSHAVGPGYHQEVSHVYGALYVIEAFRKAMITLARRIAATVVLMTMQVFFREYPVSPFGGEEQHQPRYLEILILPSVSTRRQFATSSGDSFLLLECFPSSSQALSTEFAQISPPVFQRCLKIIQSHLFSMDDLDSGSLQFNREIINCSFNLFAGPSADIDHGIICLVWQSNLRNLLLHYCLDVVPDIGQRALAFLQHLGLSCPVHLKLFWAAIFDTMTMLLNTFIPKKPIYVANNACWIIRKSAIKVLQEIASVLACLVQPLDHALVENKDVTVRNLTRNGLELVFYHIEQFMQVWCPTLPMILRILRRKMLLPLSLCLRWKSLFHILRKFLISRSCCSTRTLRTRFLLRTGGML